MRSSDVPERLLAHRLSQLTALTDSDFAVLSGLAGRGRTLQRGDLLKSEGDQTSSILLVVAGWALRFKRALDGRRQVVGIMLPGELTEIGPPLPFGVDHSIQAVTRLEVLEVSRAGMVKAAAEQPQLGQALLLDATFHSAMLREWLARLSRRADERVAYLFYETFVRLRGLGLTDGDSFEFPLVQQDVADCAGISVVHLNRVLGSLRTQKLIEWTKGALRLPQPQRLAELAQFSSGLDRMYEELRRRTDTPG